MMTTVSRLALLAATAVMGGCASYSGAGLESGRASLDDVIATMGPPAMRWALPDGRTQLAYPRGPEGVHSFMAWMGADGRLDRIENVLVPEQFSKIRPGMPANDVLQILGPPVPYWTTDFPARRERAWEWRVCYLSSLARFTVLMDMDTHVVRNTFVNYDVQGPEGTPICTL